MQDGFLVGVWVFRAALEKPVAAIQYLEAYLAKYTSSTV